MIELVVALKFAWKLKPGSADPPIGITVMLLAEFGPAVPSTATDEITVAKLPKVLSPMEQSNPAAM